eukprot:7852887-Pyramimonas_sp.AAC.2
MLHFGTSTDVLLAGVLNDCCDCTHSDVSGMEAAGAGVRSDERLASFSTADGVVDGRALFKGSRTPMWNQFSLAHI